MRRALGCARIEARLTWLTQLSWRSMSSRQFKWMKGSELTADAHLRAIEMRVKVREPTVAARADESARPAAPRRTGGRLHERCMRAMTMCVDEGPSVGASVVTREGGRWVVLKLHSHAT